MRSTTKRVIAAVALTLSAFGIAGGSVAAAAASAAPTAASPYVYLRG